VIQAISFDAAGTLIEPAEPVAETYVRILSPHLGPLNSAQLAASFPQAFKNAGLPDYTNHQNGDTAEREWWRKVVETTLGQPIPTAVFHELFEHFAKSEAWRVFPEVPAVLNRVSELGLKCIVISNFDLRLHRILDSHALAFKEIITSASARSRKPSRSIFLQALGILQVDAKELLHVGDSEEADLIGAKAAGIDAYLLERPSTDLWGFMDWVGKYLEIG
jgi:putative hydrolase of the HAD superfamily